MRMGTVIVVCALTSALVSGGTFFLLRHLTESGDKVAAGSAVPALTGLTADTARALIQPQGLLLVVSEQRPSSEQAGQILSQQPAAGSPASEGDIIQVVVASQGAQAGVAVPPLAGLDLEGAVRALAGAGMELGPVARQAHAETPAGQVVSATPAPGQEAARGTKVALVLSSGPQGVAVPQVIGKTTASARRAIEAAGLTVGKIRYRYDEDMAEGRILSQSPAGGAAAPGGSAVDWTVNADR